MILIASFGINFPKRQLSIATKVMNKAQRIFQALMSCHLHFDIFKKDAEF